MNKLRFRYYLITFKLLLFKYPPIDDAENLVFNGETIMLKRTTKCRKTNLIEVSMQRSEIKRKAGLLQPNITETCFTKA